MENIFLKIFDFFKGRRALLIFLSAIIGALLIFSASRINIDENIMSIIPHNGEDKQSEVFSNLKVKDKVIVMIHRNDTLSISQLCEIADSLYGHLSLNLQEYAESIYYTSSGDEGGKVVDFVRGNLPQLIGPDKISQLDSMTSDSAIEQRVRQTYEALYSPFGSIAADFNFKDPLGLTSPILMQMKNMQISDEYCFYDNHMFMKEDSTALIFINPKYPASHIAANKEIVTIIESSISRFNGVEIDYFGGPCVAAYNSWQVQKDLNSTLYIALGVILVTILLAFRNKKAALLILLPGLFGVIFALGVISTFKDSISLIAIGASSAIVGVVLSYSIHVICHGEHCKDIRQLIEEMASPLTVGGFTTIGAFYSLTFTSSSLLQDFGYLASLTIVGASLFCLIILPHMMSVGGESNPTKLYRWVERVSDYHFENSKVLIACIVIISMLGLWWANESEFNADMEELCYHPTKLEKAEKRLMESVTTKDSSASIYFVATASRDNDGLLDTYRAMNEKLANLHRDSTIRRHSYFPLLLGGNESQALALKKWNEYWTEARTAETRNKFKAECRKVGLPENSFDEFFANINSYKFTDRSETPINGLNDWIPTCGNLDMAISNIELDENDKDEVYDLFKNDENVVILDKPHFISNYMESVKDDFYFVLFISSFIVFLALLLNYGCIETALLSFLPMAMSYLIILCFMHLFDIKFNIVSVILSTFIFGIGDDFSIFITDGLVEEYKNGRKMLSAHKTAIFFSAFVSIVGMGALIFAEHPSMKSVAQSSLIGMIAVVVIAYTVQPFLFKHFVTNRTKNGLPPYTISSILWTIILLGTFGLMGIVLSIVALLVQILPMPRIHKTNFLHYMICGACRSVLAIGRGRFKIESSNPEGEDFKKPAMIVANHQSVLDIVRILALTPKVVIMAKKSNWNSPLYGLLLHLSGFFCSDDNLDETTPKLKELVDNGYSICVFPEGHRSADGEIGKFKSGAYHIAKALRLDLVQVVFTGHYQAINRNDLLYTHRATISMKVLPRKKFDDILPRKAMLESEQTIRMEYNLEKERTATLDNPYYEHIVTQNFIYKGPVLEHYTKMKLKFEKCYAPIISLIDKDSTILDLGCGYGYVSMLISELKPNAKITAVDYDAEKIEVAKHCFIGKNIDFICQNVVEYELPQADTYIISDMLHYISHEEQEALIGSIIEKLPENGKIIIRDANSEDKKHHKLTRISEWLSTSWLLGFNKKNENLSFFSVADIERIISPHDLKLKVIKSEDETSNVLYCVEKLLKRSI